MMVNDPAAVPTGTSPSASGPAGALFEGQVAAHYLLTMLAEADPRGLPGTYIEAVELIRADEGHPLDDVIVRGVTRAGEAAVLEVQVKRTVTFSPSDAVFKGVVEQLAQAFQTCDLAQQRHQFAVATERTSFKITGPYQDVLRWARELSSAAVFFGRLRRRNVGNDNMRTFVETVRTHLQGAGCASDNETVWRVLRRFQILTFDYDAPGSQSLELALERARNLLDPTEAMRASALWRVMTETAIRVAATGGDIDRSKLIEEITGIDGFRLLGSRRNRAPREDLAEAGGLAAAGLRGSIAEVTLARSAQLDAVRDARDHGRYVEIRGDPGVGKSGLLGMLVEHMLTEGRAIVLTPERTLPGGWLAFKSALRIEGTAESFLSDLASDGGAALFVDSLDFFDDPGKRATVIDLVRAAASVPAFQVIVTARTDFDQHEPSWLPPDALATLVRARPVVLAELEDEEVKDLKAAAPTLRALLTEDHPARAIARNLFRLSRLLEMQGSTDQLRSEVDLLERWWTTGDGPSAGRRERQRVLADLADAILADRNCLDSRTELSATDALIARGTLRELGLDRFVFRHDVLREWGVAARLRDSPDKLDQLPLSRVAPAALARGVELGARFVLERSEDGQAWGGYLNRVSRDGAHPSWRRWSLLAILRSELAFALLDRASASLTENDGVLLRELIRTTLAAESRPLAETLAEHGANVAGISASIYGPINGSWATLSCWLLARRDHLPLRVLPDVIDLFQSLAVVFFGNAITPHLAVALADWLEEIEDAQEHRPFAVDPPRFTSAFPYRDLQKLAADARQAFLLMAARAPERAQSYLRRLLVRRNPDATIRDIMEFRGSLAKAAPAELMNLTLAGLIPQEDAERRSTTRNDAFTHLDSAFLPSSPAQGPFLDLLNAEPAHGLDLIRRLIGHAIDTRTKGRQPGDDGIVLVFPAGPRFFPWKRSYSWSRQADGCYAVESGLLALEAWTHARIERGDVPEQVIADVLGPEGSPAAFLLVAVDVLISHWPKTLAVAVPFLGSPDLMSLDRTRQAFDGMPAMDLGGWGAIGPKEPAGSITLANLKQRPSRRLSLEQMLATFAFDESIGRSALHGLLVAASARLGQPEPDDTFADPRFLVRFALNVIDPANWPSNQDGRVYVSPPEEARHMAALQEGRRTQTTELRVWEAIQDVLEDGAKSGPILAEHAVAYAQRLSTQSDSSGGVPVPDPRTNIIVPAAMILVRDGSDALLGQHEDWARDVFAQAFSSTEDLTVTRRRDGIRFNPVSTAVLGLIHLWRRRGRSDDRDALLTLASRDDPHAAQGFGAGLKVMRAIDPRIVPALLRCALAAQIQPTHEWDDPKGAKEAGQARHRDCVVGAIRAEVIWLNGDGPAPAWPAFPPRRISVRRRIRIGGYGDDAQPEQDTRPSEQVHSQSAALWLRQMTGSPDAIDMTWIVSFVDAYAEWTLMANGAGLKPGAEIDRRPDEWNGAFFSLLARAFTRMSPGEAAAHVARAATVPDVSFFDIAPEFVPAIDRVYFNEFGLDLDTALRLRCLLADRLMDTDGWRRECDSSDLSIEQRIRPAIAALYFNQHNPFSGTSCYLLPGGIDRVDPFLPELARLSEVGPVPFCGLLTMNLLEVSPS